MPVEIVVGVLIEGRRLLMCHRSVSSAHFPARWDFPGGHVEPGESRRNALIRELHEEIGVSAEAGSDFGPMASEHGDFRFSTMDQDGTALSITGWVIRRWTGTARNAAPQEHSEIRWVTAEKVPELNLSHDAYRPFLSVLAAGLPVRPAERESASG